MKIKLLNGELKSKKELLERMMDDSFYYGYLGKQALSSSSCKHLLTSPFDYYKDLVSDKENIQAFRDGALIHLAVLEEDKFNNLNIVSGTKAGSAFKEAIKIYGYDNVFTESEMKKASNIAYKLQSCSDIADIINRSEKEIPAIGDIMGLPFRGKADMLDGFTIYDLKTTSDISKFKYSARNYNYDIQVAIYLELFDAIDFEFIAIDKKTYKIGKYKVSPEFIESGKRKLEICVNNYRKYLLNVNEYRKIKLKDFYIEDVL